VGTIPSQHHPQLNTWLLIDGSDQRDDRGARDERVGEWRDHDLTTAAW